ncbi:MAG: mannose-1-phosphate guanylyltransferase [Planctomycetes bacterium]|nr:mannose-1-phosphate guanylyltransferase [Planctomycetota bacterium]MCB9903462.1 mannose-1-phosphate guanylyltransferase [Planctomycetota bacterium]
MVDEALYAVVMAGGVGTRFWPASRRARPKQLLSIAGERSMLAQTIERLGGLVAPRNVLVVTSAELADAVREAVPELPPENVILEPQGRNTAPCVALAAFEIERRDPSSVQIVVPADHVIEPADRFRSALAAAVREARGGRLVTLGIEPTHPATGYGYIKKGARRDGDAQWPVHEVLSFVEKPDSARAREFQESGDYLWNGGIFVWETRAILSALRAHATGIYDALSGVTGGEELARAYAKLEPAPIDVAVMERATNVSVVPVDFTWNDVGAWPSLAEVVPADSSGNHVSGGVRLVARDATDCIVYGDDDALVALVGVEGLVVVQSGKTVLVCPRDRAQEVRAIVAQLENEAPDEL